MRSGRLLGIVELPGGPTCSSAASLKERFLGKTDERVFSIGRTTCSDGEVVINPITVPFPFSTKDGRLLTIAELFADVTVAIVLHDGCIIVSISTLSFVRRVSSQLLQKHALSTADLQLNRRQCETVTQLIKNNSTRTGARAIAKAID